MSILAKNTKTPQKKQENNNLLKIKRILNTRISAKGAQFWHLAFQVGGSPPAPPSVTPLLLTVQPWSICLSFSVQRKQLAVRFNLLVFNSKKHTAIKPL